MKDLIKALTIFAKYDNPYSPTHCEHDKLTVMVGTDVEMSEEDLKALLLLGFHNNDEYWYSYRYGSA